MNRLRAPLPAQLDGWIAACGDWQLLLRRWRASPAALATLAALEQRLQAGAVVFPAEPLRALALTPLASVRVVVLGQDPYHGEGQAEGLAFSVPPGVRPPPSLRNIFKELARDLGLPTPSSGSLRPWAEQGVLLLNTTLTVEEGSPASHAKLGWQALTDAIIQACWADQAPKVFLLWGAHAQSRVPADAAGPHAVLASNHPSPLSALRPPVPFIGCGHFGAANRWLAGAGREPVGWLLP